MSAVYASVTDIRTRWGEFAEKARRGTAVLLCYHERPQFVIVAVDRYRELVAAERVSGRQQLPLPEPAPTKSKAMPPNAKLDWQKAREIRLRFATEQITQRELARCYAVSESAIWRVLSGEGWKEHE